jgi:hypothetical protein
MPPGRCLRFAYGLRYHLEDSRSSPLHGSNVKGEYAAGTVQPGVTLPRKPNMCLAGVTLV